MVDRLQRFHRNRKQRDEKCLVPRCLGFIKAEKLSQYGLVFEHPKPTLEDLEPRSLQASFLLPSNPASKKDRRDLIMDIYNTIVALHAAGHLHGDMYSHNVLFPGGSLLPYSYSTPYILGLKTKYSIDNYEISPPGNNQSLNMYRHPDLHGNLSGKYSEKNTVPLQKAHELYSLGILFLEIVYWQHIHLIMDIEILNAQPDEMRRIRDRLLSTDESHIVGEAKKELGRDTELLIRSLIHGTTNQVKLQDEPRNISDQENSVDDEEEGWEAEEDSIDEEEEGWEAEEESVNEGRNAHEGFYRSPTPISLMKHPESASRKSSTSFLGEPLIDRLVTFFPPLREEKAYDEDEIEDVAWLLKRLDRAWSETPRTYILLRMADQLREMESLLQSEFNDFHLPASINCLPHSMTPKARRCILENQHLVMSEGDAFEKKIHCHYIDIDDASFKSISLIGQSNFSVVTKIQAIKSKRVYALKMISREQSFEGFQLEVRTFINDVKLVIAWNHKHLIRLEGSLTTKNHFGIVMSPVAESNLQDLLNRPTDFFPSLQSAYGCLASALHYLHDYGIQYENLNPKAILISDEKVVLSEIIMSSVFLSAVSASQRLRCLAPEIVTRKSGNFAADIWSRGCIFLEMTVVLQGHSIEWLREYFKESGDKIHAYHTWPDRTQQLLGVLKLSPNEELTQPLECIERMLHEHPQSRPTASQVVDTITYDQNISPDFCGSCCRSVRDASKYQPKFRTIPREAIKTPHGQPAWIEQPTRSSINSVSAPNATNEKPVTLPSTRKFERGDLVGLRQLFSTRRYEVVDHRYVTRNNSAEYKLRKIGAKGNQGFYRDGRWIPEKDLKELPGLAGVPGYNDEA